MASIWLRNCIENHTTTCCSAKDTRLPTRVLDIGGELKEIRIIETNKRQGQYACLSHCWGTSQVLTTTKDTLKANEAIPWSKLPKTFQDAIEVARAVGLKYIWIDSLCILQDDKADWVKESKEMCSIYENAQVTISATAALDSTAGLFLKDRRYHIISGTTKSGTKLQIGVCNTVHEHPSLLERERLHDEWPLIRRAWAFQERVLSPRVLHFGRTEVIWQCREFEVCECDYPSNAFLDEKCRHYHALKQSSNDGLEILWHKLVMLYSPLKLTFGSDKLAALSGLAKQISKLKPQARYLAGLWSDSIGKDLMWFNPGLVSTPLPAIWQAPSWSWASTNGITIFPSLDVEGLSLTGEVLQTYFSILDARVDLATDDPNGQVQGGIITIEAHTFEVELRCSFTSPDEHVSSPSRNTSHSNPRSLFTKSGEMIQRVGDGEAEWPWRQILDPAVKQVHFDIPDAPLRDNNSTGVQGIVKCLRMARHHYVESERVLRLKEYAMVVQQLTPTTYQRIGMVIQQMSSREPVDWKSPEKLWDEYFNLFVEGGILETITIV